MTHYPKIQSHPQPWLITGAAGFIGSNLMEALLKLDQNVVGLDNFSTGHRHNLEQVKALVTPDQWNNFHFIEGDIRNPEHCRNACKGVNYVLHQAALGSVPRSLADPLLTNATNQVYNVAVSERTTLNQLFESIRALLEPRFPHLKRFVPIYRDFRAGDVRHSQADIQKAQNLLGYAPTHRIGQGLQVAMNWYVQNLANA